MNYKILKDSREILEFQFSTLGDIVFSRIIFLFVTISSISFAFFCLFFSPQSSVFKCEKVSVEKRQCKLIKSSLNKTSVEIIENDDLINAKILLHIGNRSDNSYETLYSFYHLHLKTQNKDYIILTGSSHKDSIEKLQEAKLFIKGQKQELLIQYKIDLLSSIFFTIFIILFWSLFPILIPQPVRLVFDKNKEEMLFSIERLYITRTHQIKLKKITGLSVKENTTSEEGKEEGYLNVTLELDNGKLIKLPKLFYDSNQGKSQAFFILDKIKRKLDLLNLEKNQ